jgi:hypothetical protein
MRPADGRRGAPGLGYRFCILSVLIPARLFEPRGTKR